MKRILILILLIFSIVSSNESFGQIKTELFEFQFDGKTLRGLIESPAGIEPSSVVIIVPGSGRTNFVEGNWYRDLRSYFLSLGLAVCFWDKAGCGKSEGKFDGSIEPPVKKSVDEVIAAIERLTRQKIAGSARIGLWGISRAGWICPFVIKIYPSIAFWISVSGPDDNDQSAYQLKSNLIIQGRREKDVQLLTDEYVKGEAIFVCGGSFEEYCEATKNMRNDSYCSDQAGKTSREKYIYYQKKFLELGFSVDHNTGKVDFISGFKEAVSTIKCPVLALFGEKDSQVDWRNTILYYKENCGSNGNSNLTIKTFPNCNHNMQQCNTGAREEDLSEFGRRSCDGYYDIMTDWINGYGFGK